MDEIIEGLSSVLEHSGILSHGGDSDTDENPWTRLSDNLKDLLVSSGKLQKLVLAGSSGNYDETIHEDNPVFAERNELLLGMEDSIYDARENTKCISKVLQKSASAQLNACRRLESISRRNPELTVSARLLPLAKSLCSAIRRQKISWLQSNQLMEDCIQNLYSDNPTNATDKLQIVYKRVNRRCINPDRSPWKEAMSLLESVAGGVPPDDPISSNSSQYICQDAILLDVLPIDSHSMAPGLRRFDNSTCAAIQLKPIVNEFFGEQSLQNHEGSRILSMLIVGPEGSGKSYLLNEIEKQFGGMGVDVLHPVLSVDAIGDTVGAAEDTLISMICYAKTHDRKCLILLDDSDVIFGQTEQQSTNKQDISVGNREPHSTARLRYLFFSLLDVVRDQNYSSRRGKIVLICSSKQNFGKDIDRFDKILPLLPPNKEERRKIISNYVDVDAPVESFADYALGLSRAEIGHHCREALISLHSIKHDDTDTKDFLFYLKEKLQSSTPESLKHGANADFVDMTVLSARDLQQLHPIENPKNPVMDLPLFGKNAMDSWDELRRLIVLPVCQSSEIDKILYHRGGASGKKAFAGGVLLASSPGTGKSTLAYFSAAVASSINHSVKLIDVSCTSLIHKEVGGSERALHRLFQSARSATPCIVVLDGIENIAAVRGNDNTTEGTMDRLLSTLLTELDGVDSKTSTNRVTGSMAIIGITHNPEWIDPALRRPGRLERTIWLGNPDLEGRKQIVMKELGKAEYRPGNIYPELKSISDLATEVARHTDGYTGAEIIAICNESKILALNKFLDSKDGEKEDCITPELVLDAVKTEPESIDSQ